MLDKDQIYLIEKNDQKLFFRFQEYEFKESSNSYLIKANLYYNSKQETEQANSYGFKFKKDKFFLLSLDDIQNVKPINRKKALEILSQNKVSILNSMRKRDKGKSFVLHSNEVSFLQSYEDLLNIDRKEILDLIYN